MRFWGRQGICQLSYAKGSASLTHQLEQGEPVYIYGLRCKLKEA